MHMTDSSDASRISARLWWLGLQRIGIVLSTVSIPASFALVLVAALAGWIRKSQPTNPVLFELLLLPGAFWVIGIVSFLHSSRVLQRLDAECVQMMMSVPRVRASAAMSTAPHPFRGGARISWTLNASWPLAQLLIESSKLTIRVMLMEPIVTWKKDIQSIALHKGFVSTGIRFEFPGASSPLVFWSFDVPRVFEALREADYV
jgi:hypothetical protein